jgi:type I restriction enzyme S subunit
MKLYFPITEVCDFQGGTQPPKSEWVKEPKEGYIRMLQIRDFTQPEKNNIEYVVFKKHTKTCKKDDVLIGRYGASIGKICSGLEGAYNVALIKTKPDRKKLDTKFLMHILKGGNFQHFILNVGSRAAQAGFNKEDLKNFEIPLPPLKTQQRIAGILDNAAALRDKTAQLLTEYDLLAQSVFLEMFGDPVNNKKEFKIDSLLNYGSFKNGLNYSKNESGFEVRYLGVGNFKSKYRISDVENLSTIHLTKLPSDDYFLKDGDLVFVRSNGNKALVGRCLSIYPGSGKVTFSGFCIRYRLNNEKLSSVFLTQLLRNKSLKKAMLKSGRGASIQNINQKILSELKVIIPPIQLQNQFADKIALIEQQKALAKQELQESEDLFNCLLQQAFKGEI